MHNLAYASTKGNQTEVTRSQGPLRERPSPLPSSSSLPLFSSSSSSTFSSFSSDNQDDKDYNEKEPNTSYTTVHSTLMSARPLIDSSRPGLEEHMDEKKPRKSRQTTYYIDVDSQSYNTSGISSDATGHDRFRTVRPRRRPPYSAAGSSVNDPPASLLAAMESPLPYPKLEKAGPYLTIAALQAYTILTVVRCLADSTWIELKFSGDKSGGKKGEDIMPHWGAIGRREKWFLGFAIAFTLMSCVGVTLRIMDRMTWLKRTPVVGAYLQAACCIAAMSSFLSSHHLSADSQFSHGFLACMVTVILSVIVAIMLTIDWWRGFPSAGLSATLKALIISSFMMTFVIIIGALAYTLLENWTFDDAINFCIVSFSTIGYGNLSPTSVAGRIFFFFYGLLGICSIGFFIVSLRNAVIEQFQWRLAEQFSRPAHMTRVQTRMSAKDLSYPMARLEEEQRVKVMVKRKMILRMVSIWIVLWFGGAGVFCTFEQWSFLESLYFCYVTLTTIGFGDYVPMEPGSIEFWNIYVFVGLTIFAYILSLISESMISHIHLVDDEEVDEDNDLFGWEQSEDHNVPVMINDQTGSGSSGEVLGLDGLKWLTQPLNCVLFQQDAVYQQGRAQTVSKKALDRLRNRFHLVVRASNNAVHAIDTVAGSRERKCCMMHGRERDAGLLQHQKHQVGPQDQQLRHQFRCMSSAGRILKVPSKGRKQMMNAEYYATYGGPPPINTQSDHVIISGNTLHGSTDNISADMGHKDPPMGNAPAFIKFADKYSLPHQRIICRMSNKVASMSRRKSFQGSSRSTAGSPVSARSSFSNNGSGHFQPQGHVYGTAGYHDVMARRRHATLMASGETSPRDNNSDRGSKGRASIGHITYENHTDSWHNDVVEGVRDRDPHTHHDERVHQHHGSPRELQYLQTNALQHQPQVKFESPRDAVRDMVKPWESITPPGQRVLFEECHFESVRPSQQNVQLSAPEAANLQGSSQKYEQATLRSLKAPWPSKDEGISMDDNVKAMKATGESINDLETIQGSVEGIHRRKHQLSVATKVGTLSNEDPLDSTKQDSFFSFHPRQKRFPSDDPPDTQGSPAAVLEDEPPPLAQYDDIFASDEMVPPLDSQSRSESGSFYQRQRSFIRPVVHWGSSRSCFDSSSTGKPDIETVMEQEASCSTHSPFFDTTHAEPPPTDPTFSRGSNKYCRTLSRNIPLSRSSSIAIEMNVSSFDKEPKIQGLSARSKTTST